MALPFSGVGSAPFDFLVPECHIGSRKALRQWLLATPTEWRAALFEPDISCRRADCATGRRRARMPIIVRIAIPVSGRTGEEGREGARTRVGASVLGILRAPPSGGARRWGRRVLWALGGPAPRGPGRY
eukprot:SAG31_NODE_1155_length_9624_cov_3.380157_11_plen_129_part_00